MSEVVNMSMNNLLEIMSRLRDPKNGCPWDIEQTFETIAPLLSKKLMKFMKRYQITTTTTLKTNWATFYFKSFSILKSLRSCNCSVLMK